MKWEDDEQEYIASLRQEDEDWCYGCSTWESGVEDGFCEECRRKNLILEVIFEMASAEGPAI